MIYQPIENTGEYTTGTVYSEEYVKGLEQEIERLKKENAILKQTMFDESLLINENALLKNIIKEVREYIENNSLYEEDYDYDYEENLVVGPPSDETARKILLEILEKVNKGE